MTNPHYNDSGTPAANTRGRSAPIRSEFAAIEAGFDSVENLKADKAGPTFTGTSTFAAITATGAVTFSGAAVDLDAATTVTVPTIGSVADSTNKAATTAFVQAVLGAAGALLPVQTTHAGKYLKTNGTSASWEIALPTQSATTVGKYLRSDGSAESWGALAGYAEFSVSGSMASTDRIANVTATTAGLTVTLPDATTMANGDEVTVSFAAVTETQGLLDSTGELICSRQASDPQLQRLLLTSNATAAGTWKRWLPSSSSTGLTSPVGQVIAGATVTMQSSQALTCALAIGSDKFLVASLTNASNLNFYVATAADMSVSIGSVATVAEPAAVWANLFAVTGGYALVYLTAASGDVKTIGITVSGTTPTVGSATTIEASVVTATHDSFQYIGVTAAASGDSVLVAYRKSSVSLQIRAVQYTGTSASVGSASTLTTADSTTYATTALLAVSTTKWLASYTTRNGGVDTDNKVVVVTTSGSTISSVDTANGVAWSGSSGMNALYLVNSTTAFGAIKSYNSSACNIDVFTISGTTVTRTGGPNFGLYSTVLGRPSITKSGSTYVVACGTQAAMKFHMAAFTLSGTTVSSLGGGTWIATTPASGSGAYAGPFPLGSNHIVVSTPSTPASAGFSIYDVSAGFALRQAIASGVNLSSNTLWSPVVALSYGKHLIAFRPTAADVTVYKYGSFTA